ncbi:NepR family anti-sigma factor [Alterisphingorhabdus coralli]|uniref:NepR family anti-sigma factor n=1 Tax=Alterisphingorhabdus coralli TaxID=3071408 RepID=A0AA97I284_9SPHN|nr:NepR family anti-sigma factor [Parasphingorhabdus sp. SCSIO 66989]WOE75978.1 NepR family anti-sigma factor [Parasphingorhabdus sp. SCSIO 66989]
MARKTGKNGKTGVDNGTHDAVGGVTPDNDAIAMGSMGCQAEYSSDNDELIGEALKSVYRQTVEEALPSEFQDLLDKLN